MFRSTADLEDGGSPREPAGAGVLDLAATARPSSSSVHPTSGALDAHRLAILFLDAQRSVARAVNITEGSAGFAGGLSSEGTTKVCSSFSGCQFGRALATLPDLDGDGVPELAVGAESDHYVGSTADSSVRAWGSIFVLFMRADGGAHARVPAASAG